MKKIKNQVVILILVFYFFPITGFVKERLFLRKIVKNATSNS
jgi:hypothetical protein